MKVQVVETENGYAIFGIDKETLRALAILTGVTSGELGRQVYDLFYKVDDEVVKYDPKYSRPYLDVTVDINELRDKVGK